MRGLINMDDNNVCMESTELRLLCSKNSQIQGNFMLLVISFYEQCEKYVFLFSTLQFLNNK